MIFVLELEQEGDYEDYYQRPSVVVAASKDKSKLIDFWDNLEEVTLLSKVFKVYKRGRFIAHNIYEVEVL